MVPSNVSNGISTTGNTSILIKFIKGNIVVDTKRVNVFFNQYGKDHIANMINKGRLKTSYAYDFYRLTNGHS